MTDEGFRATVGDGDEGPVIHLVGTVNRVAKEPLDAAYVEASSHAGEIMLDFSDVDYINSTGIAVIVGILAMARSGDRTVGARGLTQHYREVFEITRLSDFMNIYEQTSAGD
jgi:anti-sigma B factor antagonist